jgi:hypothetical protein
MSGRKELTNHGRSSRHMQASLSHGNINLANLRNETSTGSWCRASASTARCSEPEVEAERTSALQGRLQELLVFELRKDG